MTLIARRDGPYALNESGEHGLLWACIHFGNDCRTHVSFRFSVDITRKAVYNEDVDSLFGNVGLFGTATRTNTLLAIHMLGETHAAEIARVLQRSPSRIKDAIDSLEQAGVVVGMEVGNARRVVLNPRFVAKAELESLLSRIVTNDAALQERLATLRRRPRRSGKAI